MACPAGYRTHDLRELKAQCIAEIETFLDDYGPDDRTDIKWQYLNAFELQVLRDTLRALEARFWEAEENAQG